MLTIAHHREILARVAYRLTSVAVAHLYNGTVLTLAKMPGTTEYQALMERLADAPPAVPPGRLASWRRWWNKKRGRPSTPEVGVLASLLAALRSEASSALARPVTHVAVTLLPIAAIARQDLADALEHAGLHHWLGYSSFF